MKPSLQIERLVACLGRLPGIGRRSASRIACELAARRDGLLQDLIAALRDAADNLAACSRCGAITSRQADPCFFCTDPSRDNSLLCVVETAMDLVLVESAGTFSGRYHVLGGKLSPMRGQGLHNLRIEALRRRVESEHFREIVLALNSDVESDATASFLRDYLSGFDVRISRPATGLPTGSGIAYIDRLTLGNAIANRQIVQAGASKPETGGQP